MNILSIQSWVAYGHVGNASAAFPLQRLGAEVWAVNTVQFSNHTGYGAWTGQVFTGEQVSSLIDGIEARGALPRCDAVLSGYMGDAGIGTAILDAVARVRTLNPAAVYCCDPVIGDEAEGVYVRRDIPGFMRDRAVPAADLATPNLFELEHLTGQGARTLDAARQAVAWLQGTMRADGLRSVLLSSLRTEATPDDAIDMLVGEAGAFHLLRTPLLPLCISGAGDALAALYLYHRLTTGSAAAALSAAGSSIHGLLRRTAEQAAPEILMVAAQEEFVRPSVRYQAVAV
jgi:pyridoxine kinase